MLLRPEYRRPSKGKPLSFNDIILNAQLFAKRFSKDTKENAEAQTFWNELCEVYGVDRKQVGLYEESAKRQSTGRKGRIDLYIPGVLAAEHKSAGKKLEDAEKQALDYFVGNDDLDCPPLIVTSDFATIRVLDLEAPEGERVLEFATEDLPRYVDVLASIAGYKGERYATTKEEVIANRDAAETIADLTEALTDSNYDAHETSLLLARLLFIFFGDDTGLWQRGLAGEFIKSRTSADGSDLGAQLISLFQVLNTEEANRPRNLDPILAKFPYVNGGLFSESLRIPYLTREVRNALITAVDHDWSGISPAIFGSMFQAVRDAKTRREAGEHYTNEEFIMRTIQPFFTRLQEQMQRVWNNERKLREFQRQLGTYTFLDPACGSGNFLIVTYRELRRLELTVMERLVQLNNGQMSFDLTIGTTSVSLDQFYGFEYDDWAATLAGVAMILAAQQSNMEMAKTFGEAPELLPIEHTAQITQGNALRLDWKKQLAGRDLDKLFILGNPPYVGARNCTPEQASDKKAVFTAHGCGDLTPGSADYLGAWIVKAAALLEGTTGEVALVSTNSISQGVQGSIFTQVLARHGMELTFAHRSFTWTSEAPGAAAVSVVIVGFARKGVIKKKFLYEYLDPKGEPVEREVRRLNFFLIEADDVIIPRLSEPLTVGVPTMTMGSQPNDGGNLIIKNDDLAAVQADPIAARYVRRLLSSQVILNGSERHCLWLQDASPSELRASPVIRERIASVAMLRSSSSRAATRASASTPALFASITQPDSDYILIPRTTSGERQWIPALIVAPEDIANDSTLVIPDASFWMYAYLHSTQWMTWVRAFSGRLGTGYQLTPSVYHTFPFIVPTDDQKAQLEAAAQELLDARKVYEDKGATLADLYDPIAMPVEVRKAHEKIDRLVDALYGLRKPTEAERLAVLVERYQQLVTEKEERERREKEEAKAAKKAAAAARRAEKSVTGQAAGEPVAWQVSRVAAADRRDFWAEEEATLEM